MPYMASAVEFTLYVTMLGKGLLHCTLYLHSNWKQNLRNNAF